MTLNELRYIVAVARERHFGRAADTCYVSQPTLSVAVKKLERELGVGLFERGQGEVSVTPAGEPIISQAQRIIEEAALLRQLASESKDQLSAPLRVGAIHTVGPYLFPSLVPELNGRAPQMPLVIREHLTEVLTEQLKRGDQDVIIISLPFDEPGIEILPLYDEPFSVLLPAFATSEIKTGFQIGFILFIPFLIVDLVVASILMSMGMMMLSPMIISLPFKIMLFVMVDGWALMLGTLASSFYS